jgi:hypothetical protein
MISNLEYLLGGTQPLAWLLFVLDIAGVAALSRIPCHTTAFCN